MKENDTLEISRMPNLESPNLELTRIFSLETEVGRREFLKRTGIVLGAASLSGMLAEILASCSSSTSVTVTHGTRSIDISSLTTNGQYLLDQTVKPDGTPILVIRQSAMNYTALSMLCTHEGCQVNSPSNGSIYCGCHGSRFNLQGQVVNGPASSPLKSYSVMLNTSANTITVNY
ncbi:MAG TPA: Rieske (2Fe-2S) protein [Candidatus Kapabacteria bacterium]|jgi:Rieske Fe-S protein